MNAYNQALEEICKEKNLTKKQVLVKLPWLSKMLEENKA